VCGVQPSECRVVAIPNSLTQLSEKVRALGVLGKSIVLFDKNRHHAQLEHRSPQQIEKELAEKLIVVFPENDFN
jgi:hypothetical protein